MHSDKENNENIRNYLVGIFGEDLEKQSIRKIIHRLKTMPGFIEHIESVNPGNFSLPQKIYTFLFCNNKCPRCKICNGPVSFISFNKGFRIYCSGDCASKDSEFQYKRMNTNKVKYGGTSPCSSPHIIDKLKNTNMNKYGSNFPLNNSEIREKFRKTCIEKYGVEWTSQIEDVKSKSKDTKRKKFFERLLTSDRLQSKCIPLFPIDEYINNQIEYKWKCSKCDNIFFDNIEDGKIPRCVLCYPLHMPISQCENELYDLYKNKLKIIRNDKTILKGNEIDLYFPTKTFGIEFNGLYWHSELAGRKSVNYHLHKTIEAEKVGINLFHIFEDEWLNQRDIVLSMINCRLGIVNVFYNARSCDIGFPSKDEADEFLDSNHLQGYISGTHIGLYYNKELISIMTIGANRFGSSYKYELLRFCSIKNSIVRGGFSKLISYFKCNNDEKVLTYLDRRYSSGNGYKTTGWKYIRTTPPSPHILDKNYVSRSNRMRYQKHLLESKLPIYDSNLSAWENLQLNGYDRIWDCGTHVYEM